MINITPQGKQAEVFALPAKGHLVVLGTAGSGKTTIALLRAYHLANLDNNKVLLVTFNAALVQYMKDICGTVPDNLTIENYHKFARGYLNCRGKMPNHNGILSHNGKLSLIEQAIEICKNCYPNQSTLRRNKEFFYDEITFIEQFGFENEDEYYKAERIGRASANIKRENRHWIYLVFEQYKTLRSSNGFKYDWDDLAYYTYQELKNDDTPRFYNHIIVDEGQDFSPMMIKSLVRAVRENGSFTFMGDVAQQIYGSRLSWRDAEISTERIWRFQINYGELVSAIIKSAELWTEYPNYEELSEWQKNALVFSDYDYQREWHNTSNKMLKQLEYIKQTLDMGLLIDDVSVLTKLECFGDTSGAGDVAILAAVYFASKYANNPVLGVTIPAFSYGIDTDTIASITGGLLGMLCGTSWIPFEWQSVQDYDCILKVTELLLEDNKKESAKSFVSCVKEKEKSWKHTPIGSLKAIDSIVLANGKTSSIIEVKWQSTLGQTIYIKENRVNTDSSSLHNDNYR